MAGTVSDYTIGLTVVLGLMAGGALGTYLTVSNIGGFSADGKPRAAPLSSAMTKYFSRTETVPPSAPASRPSPKAVGDAMPFRGPS